MPWLPHPLQFVLVALAGWINQQRRDVIDYLQEENRVLREQLGARRLRFTDVQRRRLAAKARTLGRRLLLQTRDRLFGSPWHMAGARRWYSSNPLRCCAGIGIGCAADGLGGRKADRRAVPRSIHAANSLWSAPRIHRELQTLGVDVSVLVVAAVLRNYP
jgi:hypothetical protein